MTGATGRIRILLNFRRFTIVAGACVLALLLWAVPCAFAGCRDASDEYGFSADGKAAFADFNGDGIELRAGRAPP